MQFLYLTHLQRFDCKLFMFSTCTLQLRSRRCIVPQAKIMKKEVIESCDIGMTEHLVHLLLHDRQINCCKVNVKRKCTAFLCMPLFFDYFFLKSSIVFNLQFALKFIITGIILLINPTKQSFSTQPFPVLFY